jgi:hypothetical protein
MVNVTDPYGRILDFLDRRSSLVVDAVPDPLLLRKSGSARNESPSMSVQVSVLKPLQRFP